MKKCFQFPSKILQDLETKKENQRLYLELNLIKPTMNFSLPRECSHLKINKKREQIKEDRYTEIERENRILLEKIHIIMCSKASKKTPIKMNHSLNFSQRARKQRQISIDNLSLLKRLQSKKSMYSYGKFDNIFKAKKKHSAYDGRISDNSYNDDYNPLRGRVKLSPLPDDKKKTVFKSEVMIGDKNFSIKIMRNKKDIKIIATNKEKKEGFVLILNKKDADYVMQGTKDYKKIVDSLNFDGEDLVLYDHHSEENT
ncbi:hypothetical protein SteCoe_28023 [Stentor coeruleus]|uniref:Uncharacterized protein n=1 Tax=Stentor coeruleus TaxID=5963 RepID=A0A1R2B972_9CILI|nr:hypothetical protein SteCoe_28023 [Stentor coeruleus]